MNPMIEFPRKPHSHVNDSGWFRGEPIGGNDWRYGAACRGRLELPWTADVKPSEDHRSRMAALCAQCPARVACGAHGLHDRVDGGWWAGVWIPWRGNPETADGMTWQRARNRLRAMLGLSATSD